MFSFDWTQKEKELPVIDETTGEIAKDENGKDKTYIRPPVFSGSVKVKIPKHQERVRFAKTLNTVVDTSGALVQANTMSRSEQMMDFAVKHIEKVDLKRVSDGYVFNSIEMLEYDKDGAHVLMDIANHLIEGISLGKS